MEYKNLDIGIALSKNGLLKRWLFLIWSLMHFFFYLLDTLTTFKFFLANTLKYHLCVVIRFQFHFPSFSNNFKTVQKRFDLSNVKWAKKSKTCGALCHNSTRMNAILIIVNHPQLCIIHILKKMEFQTNLHQISIICSIEN